MKSLLFPIMLGTSLLLAGCRDDKAARNMERAAKPTFMLFCFRKEIVSEEYHVPEMSTPMAAAFIEEGYKFLPGYIDSTVDLESHTITVRYKSSTMRKMNIEEAIAMRGFAVNNRPAYPNVKMPEGIK